MAQAWDATWHELLNWTNGSAQAERLAAQLLIADGFKGIDPSHPLGGPDGGVDIVAGKGTTRWRIGVYFPRGAQPWGEVRKKFKHDLRVAALSEGEGFVFVTNQEIKLSQRESLRRDAKDAHVDLLHLERIVALLDQPTMAAVRAQFLGGDVESARVLAFSAAQARRTEGLLTGGDSFAYCMFYNFDLEANAAREFVVIKVGEFPLYDLNVRVVALPEMVTLDQRDWGNVSAPAVFMTGLFSLDPELNLRIFHAARNGNWHQDLVLRRVLDAGCWLAATRVFDPSGHRVTFEHVDHEFEGHIGKPDWSAFR